MNKIAGIKAVSFDGDGTLWDFEEVMRHSLQHVMKELERLDPQAAAMLTIEEMIRVRNEVSEELKGKVTNLEKIRLEAFLQTLKGIERQDDDLAAHLNEVYLKHRFEDIELLGDVLPTLKALKKRFTLGLVSNGNSYPNRCGLEEMFRFVVFSQDHGVVKPDPAIFRIALKRAGCLAQEFLHVGDSLEEDIRGAIDAGIMCVWLNRKKMKSSLSLKADYEISSLSELPNILVLE